MASNNYNSYNYAPYQQSAPQNYPAYQTASAPNNAAQSSHQYQQPASTHASDYVNNTGSSYGAHGNGYGYDHDSSWNGSNYGSARETTRGAAEALRNMSNTSYALSNASTDSKPAYTSVNTANAQLTRPAPVSSHSPQVQAQQVHIPTPTYSQGQARPQSMSTSHSQTMHNRGLPLPATPISYPPQHAQTLYHQQQRPASPAQPQYTVNPASHARSSTLAATKYGQYSDYSHRKLPGVETTNAPQIASTATSSNYTENQQNASTSKPPTPSIEAEDAFSTQRTTTVDPSAVYDPYADIQRRAEIVRAEKAREDALRAEEERVAEEMRKAEEKKAEEKRAEEKKAEERKRQEEIDKAREPQPKSHAEQTQKQETNTTGSGSGASEPAKTPEEDLEAAMRAMMAKMRELNSKDPAMLARIWEEERRAKVPKVPRTQDKPSPKVPAPLPGPSDKSIQGAEANGSLNGDARKKPMSREPAVPTPAKTATPIQPPTTTAKPKAPPPPVSNRPGGNTIWPLEKRAQLANAAVAFLRDHNPSSQLNTTQVLSMLDSNPSYIQLCEQLEQLGLKLDRAAFAKSLLTAVPDVNSGSRKTAPQPAPVPVKRPAVPPAVMKSEMATPIVASPHHTTIATLPARSGNQPQPPATPASVAEMVPIKAELRQPANKEEAARKRNLSDLVDLTQLSDEDEFGPPMKKAHSDSAHSLGSTYPHVQDSMVMDAEPAAVNFPIVNVPPSTQRPIPQPMFVSTSGLRNRPAVECMDRKKALRRNNYNPATIARDVLLACGRHPSERQLNQHLDCLKATLAFPIDSDLSTIQWDHIDPGTCPPGYFKERVHDLTADTEDEDEGDARPRDVSHAIGRGSGAPPVQALPQAINPFKPKRRGRPPRHSLPNVSTAPDTPQRTMSASHMSASAPRPAAAGVGYRAFLAAQCGPDGKPLPKKKGRPVGWRKAIHGSSAAHAGSTPNGHTSGVGVHQVLQPSTMRTNKTGETDPIRIRSSSPSVTNRAPNLYSYGCKWQDCNAELHNLETLKKHVFKVHCKETPARNLECLWSGCGDEVTRHDPLTNVSIEGHSPHFFTRESDWQGHIRKCHIDPMSWELGDGPASGLSDMYDSDAYLSDAHGRQVTPRIVVNLEDMPVDASLVRVPSSAPRGRGQHAKVSSEQEALDTLARLVSRKRRLGGPGMDRGGATLANDKRRRGFLNNSDTEGELVDIED